MLTSSFDLTFSSQRRETPDKWGVHSRSARSRTAKSRGSDVNLRLATPHLHPAILDGGLQPGLISPGAGPARRHPALAAETSVEELEGGAGAAPRAVVRAAPAALLHRVEADVREVLGVVAWRGGQSGNSSPLNNNNTSTAGGPKHKRAPAPSLTEKVLL